MFDHLVKLSILAVLSVCLLGGCQEDVVFPPPGGSCGVYYPSDTTDTDTEPTVYEFRKEGAIAPCEVWESVRVNETGTDANTYINLGELQLQAERASTDTDISALLESNWSIAEPTHMVIVASADECSACEALIGGGTTDGIVQLKDDFEANGALMVAALRYHFLEGDRPAYTLGEADEVLLESDGWPSDWHRTNDDEEILGLLPGVEQSYPQAFVIRLSDMRVIAYFPEGSDATDLLNIVIADRANSE